MTFFFTFISNSFSPFVTSEKKFTLLKLNLNMCSALFVTSFIMVHNFEASRHTEGITVLYFICFPGLFLCGWKYLEFRR